jgi:hypothetical protein
MTTGPTPWIESLERTTPRRLSLLAPVIGATTRSCSRGSRPPERGAICGGGSHRGSPIGCLALSPIWAHNSRHSMSSLAHGHDLSSKTRRWNLVDYREALCLDRQFTTGTSASLPGWRLAMPDRDSPHALTLAGRTAEVFDQRLETYGGGASRWGLAKYLTHRVEDLLCAWTSIRLLDEIYEALASARDRAPTIDESSGAFARRLSHDVNEVLRRGSDAGALCADCCNGRKPLARCGCSGISNSACRLLMERYGRCASFGPGC